MKNKLTLLTTLTLTASLSLTSLAADAHGKYKQRKKININTQNITNNINNIEINSDRIAANEDEILNVGSDIDSLDTRVNILENTNPQGTTTLAVDCLTESISNVLSNATPIGQLVLEINGACSDNIIINRDNVSLIGLNGASITYNSTPITDNENRTPISNVITVIGGDNILIKGLALDGASNALAGIHVLNNGSVLVKNSQIGNANFGIWASNNSSLQMSTNTVQNNSDYGVLITDGATTEIRENNKISHSANSNGALGVFRNGTARVRQSGNEINNWFANGKAIEVYHGSQLRSDRGTLVANGRIDMGFFGQVELRDSVINGAIRVNNEGLFRIKPNANVIINGDIRISNAATTTLSSSSATTNIYGDIICTGYNAAIFGSNNAIISGSTDLLGSCNQ